MYIYDIGGYFQKDKLRTFMLEQNIVKSTGKEYTRRAKDKWRAEQCYDIQDDIKKTHEILKDQTSAREGYTHHPRQIW